MSNLDQRIRDHPIYILGGFLFLGVASTAATIAFLISLLNLEVVSKGSTVTVQEVSKKYVPKSDYDRLFEQLQIVMNRATDKNFEGIFTLRTGFKNLASTIKDYHVEVRPAFVKAYNLYAKRFNAQFPQSKIPDDLELEEAIRSKDAAGSVKVNRGAQAIKAMINLALSTIDGRYICTSTM